MKIYASSAIKIRYASCLSTQQNKEASLRFATRARPHRLQRSISHSYVKIMLVEITLHSVDSVHEMQIIEDNCSVSSLRK